MIKLGRLILIMLLSVGAHGSDLMQDWQFSGFASFGAGRLADSGQSFIRYDDEWSVDTDSVLGLQVNKQLSDQWGFIGQVVANGYNYSGDDLYTPELEWLLLSFEPNANMQFRFGRIRNPLYFYSSTLEVGYTYEWIRPSANTYPSFLDPFKHMDGMDFTYRTSHGDVDVDYQFILGHTSAEFIGLDIEAHSILGANITAQWDSLTFRFNYEKLDVSLELVDPRLLAAKDGFLLAYQNTGVTEFLDITKGFGYSHEDVEYFSSSILWEVGNWQLTSEVMNFRTHEPNFSNDADGYYISIAYQWEDYIPYARFGEFHNRFSKGLTNQIEATEAVFPVGTDPSGSIDKLRDDTVTEINFYNGDQETLTLGVRYDFHAQANFKVEVEYLNLLNGTSGNLNLDSAFAPRPSHAILTSFVIDVVF